MSFLPFSWLFFHSYPDQEQLKEVYSAYLRPVLLSSLSDNPQWGTRNVHLLAESMVRLYSQLKSKFTVDDYSHYVFTPRDLTAWVLALMRYDLAAGGQDGTNHVLKVRVSLTFFISLPLSLLIMKDIKTVCCLQNLRKIMYKMCSFTAVAIESGSGNALCLNFWPFISILVILM